MSSSLIVCTELINKHFQLPSEELEPFQTSEEELLKGLSVVINNLMNQDMTRLLNAFYKIDIDEVEFKKIISTEAPDQIALSLAKEVFAREMQKVKTREKYRNF